MDLGIAGRRAMVCASSRGLGRACAWALAEAGCELVINGRDAKALEETARELRAATGAKVTPVIGDLATPEGQTALLAACPQPDILVNNNAGPPFRDFRQLTRQQMIDGVIANMVVAIELTQKVIDAMVARKFGRIVNITSGSVKMPLAGLDLSSGARAGLTAFFAGVARSVAASNVTDQFSAAGNLRDRSPALQHRDQRQEQRDPLRPGEGRTDGDRACSALRRSCRVRCRLRVPMLGPGRLHYRSEYSDRRRRLSRRILIAGPPRCLLAASSRSMIRLPAGDYRPPKEKASHEACPVRPAWP